MFHHIDFDMCQFSLFLFFFNVGYLLSNLFLCFSNFQKSPSLQFPFSALQFYFRPTPCPSTPRKTVSFICAFDFALFVKSHFSVMLASAGVELNCLFIETWLVILETVVIYTPHSGKWCHFPKANGYLIHLCKQSVLKLCMRWEEGFSFLLWMPLLTHFKMVILRYLAFHTEKFFPTTANSS